VFVSLLKSSNPEARSVIKHALNILTPAIPVRIDNGEEEENWAISV